MHNLVLLVNNKKTVNWFSIEINYFMQLKICRYLVENLLQKFHLEKIEAF